MHDLLSRLSRLNRPALLIRAARHGAEHYRREVHLKRHMDGGALPRPGRALARLIEEEERLNGLRLAGDGAYSVARHVEVAIALMGEARVLRAALAASAPGPGPVPGLSAVPGPLPMPGADPAAARAPEPAG